MPKYSSIFLGDLPTNKKFFYQYKLYMVLDITTHDIQVVNLDDLIILDLPPDTKVTAIHENPNP